MHIIIFNVNHIRGTGENKNIITKYDSNSYYTTNLKTHYHRRHRTQNGGMMV